MIIDDAIITLMIIMMMIMMMITLSLAAKAAPFSYKNCVTFK